MNDSKRRDLRQWDKWSTTGACRRWSDTMRQSDEPNKYWVIRYDMVLRRVVSRTKVSFAEWRSEWRYDVINIP